MCVALWISSGTWGKTPPLPEPLFPSLLASMGSSTSHLGLKGQLNKITHTKHFRQCLEFSQCSANAVMNRPRGPDLFSDVPGSIFFLGLQEHEYVGVLIITHKVALPAYSKSKGCIAFWRGSLWEMLLP